MLTRILTSICAVCVLVPVLWFSNTVLLPIGIAAVTVIATYEMAKCMGLQRRMSVVLPIYASAGSFPFLLRYLPSFSQYAMIAFLVAAMYLLYLFFLVVRSHGTLTFQNALTFFAICLYVIVALNAILYIHDEYENGRFLYVLIFLGAWITDIFAYFTGVFFGKHKLIPDVSPKKTVEGSVGGVLFCALFYVGYGALIGYFFEVNVNLLFLGICGLILSVISQIGDLIMSVIKRHYGIKDFGKIFPGHGGVLDRFDSILAVSLGLAAIVAFSNLFSLPLM